MKVTKLIREYVEEQVSKVYDSKENPYSKQAALDKKMLEDFTNELQAQQKEVINQFLTENVIFDDGWNGLKRITRASTQVPSFSYYRTQAMLDEKEWAVKNKKAKNDKIREIMIALELGANRQELNDMIAKLLEDAND